VFSSGKLSALTTTGYILNATATQLNMLGIMANILAVMPTAHTFLVL
jgi:hypothetical protein